MEQNRCENTCIVTEFGISMGFMNDIYMKPASQDLDKQTFAENIATQQYVYFIGDIATRYKNYFC